MYDRCLIDNADPGNKIVLDALLMVFWRRKLKQAVIIHTDQCSQFGIDNYAEWCKDNNLIWAWAVLSIVTIMRCPSHSSAI